MKWVIAIPSVGAGNCAIRLLLRVPSSWKLKDHSAADASPRRLVSQPRGELPHQPFRSVHANLAPAQAGDALHGAIAHRGILAAAKGEPAQGMVRLLRGLEPGQDGGPSGQLVQWWQAIALQQAREL